MADMELQANIVRDGCKCTITDEEPVITLAKERKEPWGSLLKQRVSAHWPRLLSAPRPSPVLSLTVTSSVEQNPNVAFDFDHWEEREEEESPFPKGKMGCTPSWGGPGAERHGAHLITPLA